MLNRSEVAVLDRHGTPQDGVRVAQWEGASSVYFAETGRLWVHNHTSRKHAKQEFYFHSVNSVAGTLTCAHPIKLWDLRRCLTPRETARLQGFPDSFVLPQHCYNRLFGNAVAIPCATYACSRVLDGSEKTHFDLCAGIGGFAIAAHSVNPNVQCVGFSEIIPSAVDCYRANFPHAPLFGDATAIEHFPKCDLLTAGFPCQPFSNANPHKMNKEHQHVDFYKTVLGAIQSTECTRIVLENVANFLTVGNSRWGEMKSVLTDLGFKVNTCVLNAKDHGLPQNRKRVYIVGRKGELPLPFSVEPGEATTIASILEE